MYDFSKMKRIGMNYNVAIYIIIKTMIRNTL